MNTYKLCENAEMNGTASNALYYYRKQAQKLNRKKWKFDMIVVAIILGLITAGFNLYSSIKAIDFKQTILNVVLAKLLLFGGWLSVPCGRWLIRAGFAATG